MCEIDVMYVYGLRVMRCM